MVQIKPGPIKPIMQRISEVITFFEEDRKTQNRGHGIKAFADRSLFDFFAKVGASTEEVIKLNGEVAAKEKIIEDLRNKLKAK